LKWHPDRNNDPQASFRFGEICESYKLLIDIEQRRDYDRWLHGLESTERFPNNGSQTAVSQPQWPKPDYSDHRAMKYAQRRARTAKSAYHFNHSTSPANDSNIGYQSIWQENREKEQDEHERINIRRHIHADNQWSFGFASAIVMVCIYLGIK
jgi:DnaJ-class molecular chaperone